MIELLGSMPHSFAISGKQFENFFSNEGSENGQYSFRRIKGLKSFPLKQVLIDKYKFKMNEAA